MRHCCCILIVAKPKWIWNQYANNKTMKILLILVVNGTAISRLNILFQAVLHLHHEFIHTCMHTNIHRCIYVDAHTQISIHIHRCTYKHAHTYTPYTYKYTSIHSIHIHTHTMEWIIDAPHTQAHTPLQNLTNTYFPF